MGPRTHDFHLTLAENQVGNRPFIPGQLDRGVLPRRSDGDQDPAFPPVLIKRFDEREPQVIA